jgi:alpha,alpha-trehalase
LNSILFKTEGKLSEFHELLQNEEKSAFYKKARLERQQAINNILWDSKSSRWADLNRRTNQLHLEYQYATDLSPLWSGVKPPFGLSTNKLLAQYKNLLTGHISGIPASSVHTGQQWDYPNVWAPYNQWLVEYLARDNATEELAFGIAQRFVNTVYCSWRSTGNIYEKYHASEIGKRGEGGEYVVQEGFICVV